MEPVIVCHNPGGIETNCYNETLDYMEQTVKELLCRDVSKGACWVRGLSLLLFDLSGESNILKMAASMKQLDLELPQIESRLAAHAPESTVGVG